jgi:hypothetical protein
MYWYQNFVYGVIFRMINSRNMRYAGHIARMGGRGTTRRRWVDNIKIYIREIGWDDIDWFDQA